jgi:protein TonB
METKKNPSHDVHAYRELFFLVGICVSVFLSIAAFQWTTLKQPLATKSPQEWTEPVSYLPVITIQESKRTIVPQAKSNKTPAVLLMVSDIPALEPTDFATALTTETDHVPSFDFIEPLPDSSEELPVVIAEKMPEPVGGYEKFYQQLSSTVVYTRQALRAEVQGKVFVEFVVNQDGSLSDAKIVKGIGYGCDDAAREAILKTKWEPGRQRGKPVRVKMVLPVYFKIP